MIRLMALIAVACLSAVAQVNSEKLFSLRGQLVDGGTGRPVSGADLELATSEWKPVGESVRSDSEGRFQFRGLSAGWYVLSASRPDFGTVYYGELPRQGAFLTIPVGADVADAPVVFKIKPVGTITGAVRDHYGEPVAHATVSASRLTWSDGRIIATSAGLGITDDRGRYRLGRLRPGAYAICAEPGSSPSTPSVIESADASVRPEAHIYARACYPASPSSQSTFRLASGQHTDVDLAVESISAVSLRGRVVNGPPKSGVAVQLVREDFIAEWQTRATGTGPEAPNFEFHGIVPGHYRLEANVRTRCQRGGAIADGAALHRGRARRRGRAGTGAPACGRD
jgi:hypothetical protein